MRRDLLGKATGGLAVLCALSASSASGISTTITPSVAAQESNEALDRQPHAVIRRLTAEQYRNAIADAFGKSIDLGGYFEPDVRVDGLVEVGAGSISVSSAGLAQFDTMARTIASQIVSEKYRNMFISCTPPSPREVDDSCASSFIGEVGQTLFRRPLTVSETADYTNAAANATRIAKDFYSGLSLALSSILISPQFLYRKETLEPDPDRSGSFRLDGYSKASRLSFFLWNTLPDAELLRAAEDGDLETKKGLSRQVDRMISSPRLTTAVRAFFSDMLQLNDLDELAKDSQIYPKFDSKLAQDAKEQTLRTVTDALLTHRGDYRDLFTTRQTFITGALASVYKVVLPNDLPNGSLDRIQPFKFSEGDPRVGILTHLSFVALHSHPGRSSPTERGKALREIIMCQKVPPPPANVKFSIVQDTSNPEYKTARSRLTAHATNPVCAGCHKITDPMGLALENFDGGGSFRIAENGAVIDTSGQLNGIKFSDSVGLGQAVHDSPAVTSCLVDRLTAYALGRTPGIGEKVWVDSLKESFARQKYILPELMREIAISPEFYRAPSPPKDPTKAMLGKNSEQLVEK